MLKPTVGERRTLSVFFQCAAPKLGLYNRASNSLVSGADQDALFQTNLKMLRELQKKGVEPRRIEHYCRFCLKEKREVQWIKEVLPDLPTEMEDTDRNLLRDDVSPIHRSLRIICMPVTRLGFGDAGSTSEGEFTDTRVETYTLGELLELYFTTFELDRTKDSEKSSSGAFNYLLASHSLDAILFAIDYAKSEDANITNPLKLQDKYILEAEEEIRARRSRA